MTKTIETKYKKLDEVSHVLLRPGRYLGSISPHTANSWIYDLQNKTMNQKEITWCPALLKVFDEIISNSADFSKTKDGSHVSTIKVTVDKDSGYISVYDDGGIPVIKHSDHDQYIPEMIYELRAGSNFNDDEENADNEFGTGQNGEGAALTCIFSTEFNVHTSDGKNSFKQTHTNNSRDKTKPKIKESDKHFTEIKWIPDFEKLNLTNIDEDNFLVLLKRTVDIAACNPKLKVYFNSERIQIKNFNDYIKMYQETFIFENNENWKVGIAHSEDGFEHISFVNGTMTKTGGSHIDYISNQIVNKLREYFSKKHKVDVKPAEIKNHLRLFIDCSIIRPRYDSQTKDLLITEIRNFGTTYSVSDKFIRQLTQSTIIQSVLDWVEAKAKANELAELRKMNKDASKVDPRRVEKFSDANERKDRHLCELYLAEGDSARKSIQSARGKNPYIGSFALRGKPLNVLDSETKDILENKEIKNVLAITGLNIGEKVNDIKDLRFGKIVCMTDFDNDGHHISALLINLFYNFWPELFDLGVVYRLNTPLYIATAGKKEYEFFTEEEYQEWVKQGIKHKAEYYKGLGTFETPQFKKILENREKYLVKIEPVNKEDKARLVLAFSKSEADNRKVWLENTNYFHEYD